MLVTVLRDGASTQARARLAATPGPSPVALVDNAYSRPVRSCPARTGSSPGRPLRYRCGRTAACNGPLGVGPRGSEAIVKRLVPCIVLAACAMIFVAPAAPAQALTLTKPEKQLLALVNHVRATHNLPKLTIATCLERASRAHSREMACRGYFSHNSYNGESFSQRLTASASPRRAARPGRPAKTSPGATTPAARPRPCSRPGCTARRIAPSSSTSACAGSVWAVPRAPTKASPTSSSPPSTAGPAPSSRGRRTERAGDGRGGRKGRRARFASLVRPMD